MSIGDHALWVAKALEERGLSPSSSVDVLERAICALTGKSDAPARCGGDGGFVPADDDEPGKLADLINHQLARCVYYDGETALGGPYRIWGRCEEWYTPHQQNTVLLIHSGNRVEQAPIANALLHWGTTTPSAFLPPYPGKNVGWRWSNIRLGSDAVIRMWLADGGVAVQEQ
ncbi:MAG: hypothetical protein OXT70_01320 [Chloroflexota bacterium]|nr:hypothetical protein [Chloroflexota bacterium]